MFQLSQTAEMRQPGVSKVATADAIHSHHFIFARQHSQPLDDGWRSVVAGVGEIAADLPHRCLCNSLLPNLVEGPAKQNARSEHEQQETPQAKAEPAAAGFGGGSHDIEYSRGSVEIVRQSLVVHDRAVTGDKKRVATTAGRGYDRRMDAKKLRQLGERLMQGELPIEAFVEQLSRPQT